MLTIDVEGTTARKFKSKYSFLRFDGSEVLYEEDWDDRKNELWERSGYRCEAIGSYARCQKEAVHPHHIVKRSVLRDDRLKNLLAVCERCHRKFHPEKQLRWRKDEANVTR